MNLTNRIIKNTLLLFTALALINCSSTKPVEEGVDRVEDIPEWFINPPEDSELYFYSVGQGESSKIELSRQRAEILAKNSLAGKLGQKIEALQKLFEDEIQTDNENTYSSSFTNAVQIITNQTLIGYSIEDQKYSAKSEGGYINYTLLKMPVGAARDAIENVLSRDDEMYIRFKESEAFLELKNNLNRLETD